MAGSLFSASLSLWRLRKVDYIGLALSLPAVSMALGKSLSLLRSLVSTSKCRNITDHWYRAADSKSRAGRESSWPHHHRQLRLGVTFRSEEDSVSEKAKAKSATQAKIPKGLTLARFEERRSCTLYISQKVDGWEPGRGAT
eukprot:CAMPEP_0184487722 /NCGR_PEP_ID=MMETSP0113_2-20130426/10292_1 /TAXON_ID=91329 /ORGANISM="Norrisiella sphaerica, Strain BC52" /LENGTH=140 /DNA_ID=CAMNT_0026870111 /DNA_START=64 /DNA_END=483 /DNA_ORIENTATION=-